MPKYFNKLKHRTIDQDELMDSYSVKGIKMI